MSVVNICVVQVEVSATGPYVVQERPTWCVCVCACVRACIHACYQVKQ